VKRCAIVGIILMLLINSEIFSLAMLTVFSIAGLHYILRRIA
jgi:hypothetical protein